MVKETLKIREEMNWSSNLGELAAFIAYAQAFPTGFLALVDSYDSLRVYIYYNYVYLCLYLCLYLFLFLSHSFFLILSISLSLSLSIYIYIIIRVVFLISSVLPKSYMIKDIIH